MRNLAIIFLFFGKSIFASFDMNERMQQTYTHIINLEFNDANKFLDLERNENPDNGIIILNENYIDFLTILITEDREYYISKESEKHNRINYLKENDYNSPYYLYAQAEIHLQWAFARLKFEDYIPAAYEFVKAYSLLKQNQKKYPDFILNKKGLGLLHALLGSIPNKYKWILNLAGIKGGVQLGLSEMNEVLYDSSAELYNSEMLFLISFLQINMTNNKLLYQQSLNKIGNRYSENYLLNFVAARLSHKLGMNDYCVKVLQHRPSVEGKLPFYYLDYLLALSKLYQLDFENAKRYLNVFLVNFKGKNYKKSAYQKLAWIAYLQGDQKLQIECFNNLKETGQIFLDEDKKAQKDAEQTYFPHRTILKARLLYDGGYYFESYNQLKLVQHPNLLLDNNLLEYWYRLGRVTSNLNYPNNEVINYYQIAYEKGKNTSAYFASMSALQIGLIYEKENEIQNAEIYFNKCLKLSNFDYERGVHQKAKVGLDRINN